MNAYITVLRAAEQAALFGFSKTELCFPSGFLDILYYTILYYTILYYTILYYTIL